MIITVINMWFKGIKKAKNVKILYYQCLLFNIFNHIYNLRFLNNKQIVNILISNQSSLIFLCI